MYNLVGGQKRTLGGFIELGKASGWKFEYAKHGIVMGEHDPVLEPYAEYITDTVEQDGIWKAMEHLGLI